MRVKGVRRQSDSVLGVTNQRPLYSPPSHPPERVQPRRSWERDHNHLDNRARLRENTNIVCPSAATATNSDICSTALTLELVAPESEDFQVVEVSQSRRKHPCVSRTRRKDIQRRTPLYHSTLLATRVAGMVHVFMRYKANESIPAKQICRCFSGRFLLTITTKR